MGQYNFHPLHLFVAARQAPQFLTEKPPISQLPDPDFLTAISQFNGISNALLNTELMQMFLPIIRADFTVLESYVYTPQSPLYCPITAFGGLQDPTVSYTALSGWKEQTLASFCLHQIDGDHFFINTAKEALLNSVIQSLQFYS